MTTSHRAALAKYVLLLLAISTCTGWGQSVSDQYLLSRPGKEIPGHPAAGNHSVSVRFPHGSTATILAIDAATGWYEVEVGSTTAWIIKSYLGEKVGGGVVQPAGEIQGVVIGTWNLEWLCDGKSRGFPENTHNGPSYDARTDQDYAAIAEVIENQLHATILVLTEVNASEHNGAIPRSTEIDRLCTNLGSNYEYTVTESGGQQHVALLYDKNLVRLNSSFEIEVPLKKVENKDIFVRDPLVGHFSVLSGDDRHLSDFIVVGLHLASGQNLAKNHSAAMKLVTDTLKTLIAEGDLLPANETDIILTGDLNLSIFDNKREQELERMEDGAWDILADDEYPATRLASVPLSPQSKIDYIIVADEMRATGSEIAASQADVHQELANEQWDDFRRVFSDHFPVTVLVHPVMDDD